MTGRKRVLVAVLALGLAGALGAEEPEILEIRRLYAEARGVQQSEVAGHLILVRGAGTGWTARTPRTDEAQVTAQLDLFLDGGRVSSAVLQESSPAGEWAVTTEHYFRRDGTTAFVFSSLQSFRAALVVERRRYFDPQGRPIRALRAVREPGTGRGVPDRPGAYPDLSPRLFPSVAGLLAGLAVDPRLIAGP